MLPTQEVIDRLACRIERAYELRRPHWRRGCSSPRVWSAAALQLWEAHSGDPARLPLDPELFVASQAISERLPDPWFELTTPASKKMYRRQVYQIIQELRIALKREVRRAERAIERGRDISVVLTVNNGKLSDLGCYLVARRAGRDDLAVRFAAAAIEQHRFCPLYRSACLPLIPCEDYPVGISDVAHEPKNSAISAKFALSLN